MDKMCCYIVCRPEESDIAEGSKALSRQQQRLFCETLRLTREGIRRFLVSMEQSTDLWIAETVLSIRNVRTPGAVKLHVVVPNDRQNEGQPEKDQILYRQILSEADEVTRMSYADMSSHEYSCNMVDNSTHMIAICNGTAGSTRNTIEYARKKGLDITIINPDELKEE